MIPARSARLGYAEIAGGRPLNDWTLPAAALGPRSTCAEASDVFSDNPELPAIAVLDGPRIVGLVARDDLFAALSAMFAASAAADEPVGKIMIRQPFIVDAGCDFEKLIDMVASRRSDAFAVGFIVTQDGAYYGIGSVRLLMGAAADRLAQRHSEIQRAQMEAEQSNKSKTQFLAAVSHELRTPLNAIIGFSQIIAEGTFGPNDFERYRGYAQDIQNSGEHLLEIINDILDISKIESGKLVLREEFLDIEPLVDVTLRLVRQRALENQVALAVQVGGPPFRLRGDKRLLRQLLLNLVANAVKFTPPGGKVTVSAHRESNGGLSVVVEDTGIGIASEDIPKAMMPFGQVDSRLGRKYEGTGLGLPLAKAMAEAHGGTLKLDSQLGVGTTVTVQLPAERLIELPEDGRRRGGE
jgi:signal transduction histidine kinase